MAIQKELLHGNYSYQQSVLRYKLGLEKKAFVVSNLKGSAHYFENAKD